MRIDKACGDQTVAEISDLRLRMVCSKRIGCADPGDTAIRDQNRAAPLVQRYVFNRAGKRITGEDSVWPSKSFGSDM